MATASLPYMPAIGAVCTVRGLVGRWRVVQHTHEGVVTKCLMQCVETGEFRSRFNFEVTEMSSSTYSDVNDYLEQVTGVTAQEFDDIFNGSFQLEEVFDENETIPAAPEPKVETIQAAPEAEANITSAAPEAEAVIPQKRFKSASAEDVHKLKLSNTEKSTDRQTKWGVKILREWMLEVGYQNPEFETMPAAELDMMLQQFYAAVRTKDGQEYSKSALISVRASINRQMKNPPISRNINLMNDREFNASNLVLSGLVKSLKREGKDKTEHKEPLCDEDIEKMYKSGVFSEMTAKTLQNKVLFDIMSQFGRRGQEGLRELTKDSFEKKVDAKGRQYICMAFNEADKTHHGMDSRENVKEARMYENNGPYCPVKSFLKYTSKLNPQQSAFLQRPLENVYEAKATWYGNQAVGVNTLSLFMPRMSAEANLSKRYTNHCIRAYVSSKLHQQGFANRSIMSVTGHRSEDSLTYYVKPSDDERDRVSRALCPMADGTSIGSNAICQPDNSVPTSDLAVISPPTQSSSTATNPVVPSSGDVSVHGNRALHMFTGSITNSTITLNVYNGK